MTEFRFTPEVLAMIRARAQLGDEDWEIAGRVGCDLGTLHNICSAHGYELPDGRQRVPETVMGMDERTRHAFAAEAARRGVSAQRLMTECLAIIATDRLFVAVLD